MRQIYTKTVLVFMAVFMCSTVSLAQQGKSIWTKTTVERTSKKALVKRKVEPLKADFYKLDINVLKTTLQSAPNRKTFTGVSNVVIQFPNVDNTLESYRIKEAPIMEEALQNKYPDIRTYIGESIDTPGTVIRISITDQGLHTMSMSNNNGTQFIDPYTVGGHDYILYAKRDLPVLDQSWECGVVEDLEEITGNRDFDTVAAKNANDGLMREFRLALACTVEYAQFHGGTSAGVISGMTATMNRVNGIYERELSITMTMVDNSSIIFLGPNVNSDPYSNNDGFAMLTENQNTLNANIGFGNFDIGHVFSTGGGGVASLNSPCTGNKARGVTGLPNPTGDAFDVDFVAHEMGHQYGGPHTWNGTDGNCTTGAREPSNAYEVGSGTTIMAYAGICGTQNVQGNSDAYFHQKSLEMIFNNVSGGNSQCATTTNTGNAAPTSNAGTNYTIPNSTPYMLTGSSSDVDGIGTHTYTWEQYDLGPAGLPLETNTSGPMVRSFEGTSNPTRFIPRLEDIITSGGISTTWEKLASVARTQNFRLTVRDNDASGGQTAVDQMTVTVDGANGVPFAVTSQSTLTSWVSGDTEVITWDVAGTNAGAVNSPNVDILLSIDGGLTYTTTLATAVPNNGSYNLTVPIILEDNCRIMVKGSGNIFFNINTARIAVGYSFSEVCTTYPFAINQTISPNATAFEFFDQNITDFGSITDVNVKYDITTSNLSQLHMAMLSPTGTRSYLYAAGPCTGVDGSANMQVTFDDEAAGPITCGTNPLTGISTPANIATPEPLSGFDGEEMNGQWRFMAANIGSSNMVFNTIDIEICTVEATLLSVDEFDLSNSFSVFPNPNNGEFTVKFNGATRNINIQVVDIRGRSILSKSYNNTSDEFNQTINLGSVQSGIYLLNVNDGERTITKKIIVE